MFYGSTEKNLRKLVEEFTLAPVANGRLMRELLDQNRDDFQPAAINVLGSVNEERGCRYLVTLLWTHELLIPILTDRTIPLQLSVSVARIAAKVDNQLHIRLSRYLDDRMLKAQDLSEEAGSRLLEIVGQIADPISLQSILRKVLMHPSARIRSKVILLIGRGPTGIPALQDLLIDPDARVRANAIEALWSSHSPQASDIFREALADPNNRVIGNAILGLYLSGDTQSIPEVLKLAHHSSSRYRATAVWVMGKMQDPRFIPHLAHLLVESEGHLRNVVFRALTTLKLAATPKERQAVGVTILQLREINDKRAAVTVAVSSGHTRENFTLPGTRFILNAGSEQITDYSCLEKRTDRLCLALLIPPSSNPDAGINPVHVSRALLDVKRRTELWAVARYNPADDKSRAVPIHLFGQDMDHVVSKKAKSRQTLTFTLNATMIRDEIERAQAMPEDYPSLADSLYKIFEETAIPKTELKLCIVLAAAGAQFPEDREERVTTAASNAGFEIHAISLGENTSLRSLCKATGGFFVSIQDATHVERALLAMYASFHQSFTLDFSWPSAPQPGSALAVQVQSPTEFGETFASETWA